jgi:hypothetical protein
MSIYISRAARISIACSILRVLPAGPIRKFVLGVIYMFLLACGTLVTIRTVISLKSFSHGERGYHLDRFYIILKFCGTVVSLLLV